jgi:hypothetical protein
VQALPTMPRHGVNTVDAPLQERVKSRKNYIVLTSVIGNSLKVDILLSRATFVFDYRSGQTGTANHKKKIVKWIPRTNEAAWRIVLSLIIQLKRQLGFGGRCLFGPGSTWTSSPKMVPTPLILFWMNSPSPVRSWFASWARLSTAKTRWIPGGLLVISGSWFRVKNL